MRRAVELAYPGQTLWVIGRGPSLARLEARHIGAGPLIAINQAIQRVEGLDLTNPLYSMQKDQLFLIPERAVILAHAAESAKSSRTALERAGALLFDCQADFGFPWNVPSVVACAGLGERWGCSQVVYLCCDAATSGDTGAYGAPPTRPESYLRHASLVRGYARLPVEWRRLA